MRIDKPFGSEQNTDSKRQGEEDAESDNDSPRSRVLLDSPRAVVDQVGNEDSDGDEPLQVG